jgi:hypothetical protein
MKNRKSLFASIGRPQITVNNSEGVQITQSPNTSRLSIGNSSPSSKDSPTKLRKSFYRSPTMPNAIAENNDPNGGDGIGQPTIGSSAAMTDGGRRTSNFSIQFTKPESKRGSIWEYNIPNQIGEVDENSNAYKRSSTYSLYNQHNQVPMDRRGSHMNPQQGYVKPWPEVPRRTSEYYGQKSRAPTNNFGPPGLEKRFFGQYKAPLEIDESNQSSDEESSDLGVNVNSNFQTKTDEVFKDKSLKSEESREILASGNLLNIPKSKEK